MSRYVLFCLFRYTDREDSPTMTRVDLRIPIEHRANKTHMLCKYNLDRSVLSSHITLLVRLGIQDLYTV